MSTKYGNGKDTAMKTLLIFTLLSLITLGIYAQTTILSENFEDGTGGWVFANHPSIQNAWHIGTATACNYEHSLYISNDGGASHAYSTTVTAGAVYVYHNITIPPNQMDIQLNLDIKSRGEGSFDFARIYMMPMDVTPVATTQYFSVYGTDPYEQYRIGLDRYRGC